MKVLKIDGNVSLERLKNLSAVWGRAQNVSVVIKPYLTEIEMEHLVQIAIELGPDDFGCVVLEGIAEMDHVPVRLLKRIFDSGDKGCIESVCLRNDLDPELRLCCFGKELEHKLK
ncbi:MAG: hypothetical protein HYS20_08630 [Rhodocyclales bacterium]|nr:hypothetical protein [Rhodocyclales bacterium]